MSNRKSWSVEEERLLREKYETASQEELVSLFKISWEKIVAKAIKMGGFNRRGIKCTEAEVLAYYKAGNKLKDVCKHFKISTPTVYDILNKHGIARRNTSLDNVDVQSFIEDYAKLSMKEITTKYNVTSPTVREKAKELKLVRDKKFFYKTKKLMHKIDEIKDSYLSGKSYEILGKEYNVESSTICNIIKSLGIARPCNQYGATQNEIKKWIEEQTGLVWVTDREVLDGKELDIYNAELKIAIEYCGLHWHNEKMLGENRKDIHYFKYKKCAEKGIHLITVFEDEWVNKQEQVKGVLLSILGKNTRQIYARKCEVKSITKELGYSFYNSYHLQGAPKFGKYFAGLYFENELLAVMSFGLHHRDNNKYSLDRLCFKRDVSVIGGASKLFKYLVSVSNVSELVSWSDNRWFQGEVYSKLGFKYIEELEADYSYVDLNSSTRVSKQSQQKKKVNCPDGLTEKEWCNLRGLFRIWDCGKKVWKWNS